MSDPFVSIRRNLRLGLAVVCGLVFGIGGWAVATEIAGAVVAGGQLVVESNVKKVQHRTGGTIGTLNVREGSHVSAGQVLLRLDDAVARATLGIAQSSLNELVVRQARLEAERDGAATIADPKMGNEETAQLMQGEQRLFDLRRAARVGEKAQLQERILQAKEMATGLDQQISSKKEELAIIQKELAGVRELLRKKLVSVTRVSALERDATRIAGENGQLVATLASTKGRITETELQILQIDQNLRSEVAKELREVQGQIAEAVERKVAAEDTMKNMDLVAPQDGVVYQLAVHNAGNVISPGEPVMMIVPSEDRLAVEVKIEPKDIDQVRVGQTAICRLTAFNARTTPELTGEVVRVGADAELDQRSGRTFFTVRILLPKSEVDRLGGARLVPGMPVETFIQTTNRTVMSYLMKPMSDQMNRAFRER